MVADRLERAVELPDHKIDRPECLALEFFEVFAELVAGLVHRSNRTCPG